MHQPILRVWTSTEWRGLYEGPSPNFLRYARVQSFVAHTDLSLACFHMGTHSLCSWGFLIYTVWYTSLSLYGRNNVNSLIYNCVLAFTYVYAGHSDVESDSQNIPREFIPSRGTVLPATHGNTDDPTFFLRLSNIYEKMRVVYFSQIRTKFRKQRICIPNIYKVCICHYAYVWKVKRSYGVFWLYLDSVDKVGFALKPHFWYFTHVLPMIWGGPLLF